MSSSWFAISRLVYCPKALLTNSVEFVLLKVVCNLLCRYCNGVL